MHIRTRQGFHILVQNIPKEIGNNTFSKFFYISKNDRIVSVWLLCVGALVALLIYFKDNNPILVTADSKDSTSLNVRGYQNSFYRDKYHRGKQGKVQNKYSHYDSYGNYTHEPTIGKNSNLHPFDLNTATPPELSELGFSERQIASVMKYRSKGGIYRRPEQMSKISGMTKGQYDALLPYFTVSDEFMPASDFVKIEQEPVKEQEPETGNNSPDYPAKLSSNEIGTVNLNTADTTMLMKIPGIGSTRARQIVNYRERLGGFHSISQLNDLQNLPANAHKYFRLDSIPLRKIPINHLTVNKLVNHPYISFFQAKAINEYRQQKGSIKSLHDLAFNKNFTESSIKRLEPYITYE